MKSKKATSINTNSASQGWATIYNYYYHQSNVKHSTIINIQYSILIDNILYFYCTILRGTIILY